MRKTGIFRGDRNALYLHFGGGFLGVCIHQNVYIYLSFIIYKLNLTVDLKNKEATII